MALPSQSGRPTTTAGRIYSSGRRRRRRQGGLPVLVGGAAALALVIYGLLWAFGFFNSPKEPTGVKPANALANAGGQRDAELRQLGDPLGLSRQNNRQNTPSKPETGGQGSPAGGNPGVTNNNGTGSQDTTFNEPDESGESAARRNVLREGIQQSNGRNAGASGPTGNEVLATDGGVRPIEKSNPAEPTPTPPAAGGRMGEVDALLAKGDKLQARRLLNEILRDRATREPDRALVRTKLASLNEDLVFGSRVTSGDALSEVYEVQPGDRLSKIAQRREVATHWKLIQRVNGLKDPSRIQVGQKLKLVRGPFHAVVDKSDFRMDIYQGSPGSPESWTYIRSFSVGLGKDDRTPLGTFIIARNSKVENPSWVNPVNSTERYDKDDPRNPIGEFWLGLEGQGQASAYASYGIHGTIEPDSIGEQRSLGCVRLLPDEIALVYELLEDGISVVQIVP